MLIQTEVSRIWCTCVSLNLKVPCLRMKSSMTCTILEGGQFVGRRCPYFSMK